MGTQGGPAVACELFQKPAYCTLLNYQKLPQALRSAAISACCCCTLCFATVLICFGCPYRKYIQTLYHNTTDLTDVTIIRSPGHSTPASLHYCFPLRGADRSSHGCRWFAPLPSCKCLLAAVCLHHSVRDPGRGSITGILYACASRCMRDVSGPVPQVRHRTSLQDGTSQSSQVCELEFPFFELLTSLSHTPQLCLLVRS